MPNFLDNLKDKAVDLAQTGVAMSKQVAEIAKLKTANLAEEDAIKKAYIEIGKLYYAERGMAPEAAYAALCEKITTAKVTIEENKSRIEELKSNDEEIQESEVEIPLADEAPVVHETPVVEIKPETPVESLHEDVPPQF